MEQILLIHAVIYFPCSIMSLHALFWNLNDFVLLCARPKTVYFSFRQEIWPGNQTPAFSLLLNKGL